MLTTDAQISKSGELNIPFSRPIVFPLALLVDYDSSYTKEAVPRLQPDQSELDSLQREFERYQGEFADLEESQQLLLSSPD